ncbi:hypothetical protein IFR05_010445 [Cadophora sp. M221]|nr:hypothetical protein IFR05_010445 [Cadophora sp. M221]
MQLQFISSSLFLAIAAAQTTTTSSATSSSTGLPALVAQLPSCALDCLPTVGTEIGCAVGDFKCMCSNGGSLVSHMGQCILKKKVNTCSTENVSQTSDIATQICDIMNSSPASTAVASASQLLVSEVAKATASATSSATNGATRMDRGIGMVRAAALVALVI